MSHDINGVSDPSIAKALILIQETLGEMSIVQTKNSIQLNQCSSTLEQHGKVLNRLDKDIRGNGSPGLKTEVAVLKEHVTRLEVIDANMKVTLNRAIAIASGIGGAVAAVATALASPVFHLIFGDGK